MMIVIVKKIKKIPIFQIIFNILIQKIFQIIVNILKQKIFQIIVNIFKLKMFQIIVNKVQIDLKTNKIIHRIKDQQ